MISLVLYIRRAMNQNIAVMFGGKGHKEAASSPISIQSKEQIINSLLNESE